MYVRHDEVDQLVKDLPENAIVMLICPSSSSSSSGGGGGDGPSTSNYPPIHSVSFDCGGCFLPPCIL